MELTPIKYKQTEVGMIPEDWYLSEIESFSVITTGSSDTQDKIENGIYPFYVRSNTVERINKYSFDGEAVLTSGDGVGVGKIFHYANGKFDFHQRVYCIYNFRNVDGKYFYLQFSRRFFDRVMSMTAKSSVDSVRKEMIAKMKIPLPPTLIEQKAISQVLSDTDALIQALKKKITKKKQIKKGTMQKLLTPKEDWEVKSFGEVCDIQKGQLITSDTKIDGAIPVIAGGKEPAYFHNKPNRIGKTITISGSGANAGYVSFHNYEIFASDCSTISESKSYSIEYIYFVLLRMQDAIYKMQTGGAQPHIHPCDINPIEFPFPSLPEQKQIAIILMDIDTEISQLNQKLTKYQLAKQGMMQQLLSGKIRLV